MCVCVCWEAVRVKQHIKLKALESLTFETAQRVFLVSTPLKVSAGAFQNLTLLNPPTTTHRARAPYAPATVRGLA